MPMSDKEQVQLFRAWLKEYGYYILFSLVMFAAISFGWHFWQHRAHSHLEHATMVYGQMLTSMEEQKKDEAKLFGERLVADYSSSPYATLAALMLAKNYVQSGDLKAASDKLQFVIKKSSIKPLRQYARIRDARILIEMKQADKALKLLTVVDDKSYQAEISEAAGDALLALGRIQEAENAYRKAQQLSENRTPQSPLLKIKLRQF